MLTGVMYNNPMKKLAVAVRADTFQGAIFGNASRIAVFITPCRADKLPTPRTKNIRKNKRAKS